MKIKVKAIVPELDKIKVISKGDWIDLYAGETVTFKAPQAGILHTTQDGKYRDVTFDMKKIRLGIAMKLPKGYEALAVPRSSTYKNYSVILVNSPGVIDNSYSGNNDEWCFQALAFAHTIINKGDRICQFKIQLSQKATIWQKIKWLFTSKIKFEYVDSLDSIDRGMNVTGIN